MYIQKEKEGNRLSPFSLVLLLFVCLFVFRLKKLANNSEVSTVLFSLFIYNGNNK